jgi:hypothetical protein
MQGGQSCCCFHQEAAVLPSAATLVSPSPHQMGQFSFEYYPLSYKISSGIHHLPHFGTLACCPCSQSFLLYLQTFTDSSEFFPMLVLSGRFNVPLPPLPSVVDYFLLFMFFSFVQEPFSLPRDWAGLFSWG